jgi:hypothetical protein
MCTWCNTGMSENVSKWLADHPTPVGTCDCRCISDHLRCTDGHIHINGH